MRLFSEIYAGYAAALILATSALLGVPGRAWANLVINGSFEQSRSSIPDGWKTSDTRGRVTAVISVDQGRAGGQCVQVESLGYPPEGTEKRGDQADIHQDGIPIEGGKRYHITFWMKALGVEDSLVKVMVADVTDQSDTLLAKILDVSEKWKRFDFDFTAYRDIPRENMRLLFGMEGLGTFWVDDVEVTALPAEPARLNPRVPPVGAKNLVPNSSFEAGTYGWSSLGTEASGWGGHLCGLYGEVVSGEAWHGTRSLKIELGPGRTPTAYYDVWPARKTIHSVPLAANLGWIDTEDGRMYTLSAYIRADRPGVKGAMVFRSSNMIRKKEITLSQEWTRYEFSVPAEGNQMFVALGPDLSAAPDSAAVVWIDAVQLEDALAPSDYTPGEPLEVGLCSGKSGNVFDSGENACVTVSAANHTAQSARLVLQRRVTDYFGATVSSGELIINAAAGTTTLGTLPLGISSPGFYVAEVSWQYGAIKHFHSIRVAIIEPYVHDDSPFGLNHAPFTEKLCKLMMKAGITWARDWSVNWGHLEPEPGKLSWETSDQQIYRLRDVGMKVVSLLPPVPSSDWASTAPAEVKPELWYRMCYMPKDVTLLTDFVAKAVSRYKETVRVWEFLNEPVWTGHALPGPQHNRPEADYGPEDYIALLKRVCPVIKAADPDCTVIGGFSAEPWHFSEEFMTSGALDYIDVFNLHNYPVFRAPETFIPEMRELLALMDKHGGRKPIWITEYSYYAADQKPRTPWIPPTGHWSANRLLDDERQAADWTVRYSLVMLAHGVEKLFYHQGSHGSVNDLMGDLEFALLAPEGEPAKMYVVQAVMASVLGPKPQYVAPISKPQNVNGRSTRRVHGYAFQSGSRSLASVWVTESEAMKWQWTIELPQEARAINIVGTPIPGRRVNLDRSPVYVVSDSLSAADLASACKLSGQVAVEHAER